MEDDIINLLELSGTAGMIGDEISLTECIIRKHPTVQSGTIAARLRGLELKGLVVQTVHKRQTRNDRMAHVWKLLKHSVPSEVIASEEKSEREQNRETIEMAANFLSGLVRSKALKFSASEARAQEISDMLFSMLKKKA